MARDYAPLMNAAMELDQFKGFLTTEELKAQAEIRVSFNSARNLFVYNALKAGEEPERLKQGITEELASVAQMHPEWAETYAFIREELHGRIDSESRKSPLLRKIVRWTPTAIGVAAVIVYFSVRLFSGVEISQPIETREGLVQRAAAFERVLTYAEWEPTGYGTRSAVMGVLRWPIEPSKAETEAANEFISLVLSGHAKLSQESKVCGGLIGASTDRISDEAIKLAEDVADYLQAKDTKWLNPSLMTVLEPIKAKFPCR